MLPDWAPNLHPIVVHFPIALLFLAVGFDLVTWLLRRPLALVRVTAVLYALGALSALVAFLTGRAAADSLDLPTAVIPAVSTHADWAKRTVWFFGVLALVRLALAYVATVSRLQGTYRDRTYDLSSAELLVLHRTPDGWRIGAVHWSSAPNR